MKLAPLALVLALGSTASAQPGLTTPVAPPEAPAPLPAPVQPGELKSEDLALTLSLGGTLGSWALLIASVTVAENSGDFAGAIGTVGLLGTVLAPSWGHWYAGTIFTRGMGLRVAGGLAFTVGFAIALGEAFDEDSDDSVAAPVLGIVGAGLFLGGTIDDIVTAPRRVRRQNQERFELSVAPLLAPRSAGLALGGRF